MSVLLLPIIGFFSIVYSASPRSAITFTRLNSADPFAGAAAPNTLFDVKLESFSLGYCQRQACLLGSEEGTLTIAIGPEKENVTTLYWSGAIRKGKKFEYGDSLTLCRLNTANLPIIGGTKYLNFSVRVTASDKDNEKKWEQAANGINSLAPIGSVVPVAGAAVTTGVTFISELVKVISAHVHRGASEELAVERDLFSLCPVGVNHLFGQYSVKHKGYQRGCSCCGNNDELDSEVDFQVVPVILPAPLAPVPARIYMFLESLRFADDTPGKDGIAKKIGKYGDAVIFEINAGEVSVLKDEHTAGYFAQHVGEIYHNKLLSNNVDITAGAALPVSISLVCSKAAQDYSTTVSSAIKLAGSVATLAGAPAAAVTAGTNISQTLSSVVLASVAPDGQQTLFSLGKQFVPVTPGKLQTVSFPLYTQGRGTKIGNIEASFSFATQ